MSSKIKNQSGLAVLEVLAALFAIAVISVVGSWAYNALVKPAQESGKQSFDVEGQSNTPVAPAPLTETAQTQNGMALTADEQKAKNWFVNCGDLNICLAQCKEDTDDDFCIAEYQKSSKSTSQPTGEIIQGKLP